MGSTHHITPPFRLTIARTSPTLRRLRGRWQVPTLVLRILAISRGITSENLVLSVQSYPSGSVRLRILLHSRLLLALAGYRR